MVKVEIVDEKEVGQSPYASSSDSRTSSSASISSVESDVSVDESFFDRVAALVDIVPPTTRHSIASRISKTASIFKRGGKLVGNIVWVVTTSALLVALPLALTLEDEAKIVAQEKEMLEQQQGAQQVCSSCLTAQSFLIFISDARTHVPIWLKFRPATTKITRASWFLITRAVQCIPTYLISISYSACILMAEAPSLIHSLSHPFACQCRQRYNLSSTMLSRMYAFRHINIHLGSVRKKRTSGMFNIRPVQWKRLNDFKHHIVSRTGSQQWAPGEVGTQRVVQSYPYERISS